MNEYFVEYDCGCDLIKAPNLETAFEIAYKNAKELGLVVYHINEA